MPFWVNMIVAVLAVILSATIGKFLIPLLKKINFGQTIYEKGPSWHKEKEGTPIMGGFMFIIASIIATTVGCFIYSSVYDIENLALDNSLIILIVSVVFALLNAVIGFTDDYIKAIKKQNLGLKASQKMIMQFTFTVAYLAAMYFLTDGKTAINLHFIEFDLGIFYYPFMLLAIVFITNSVNLTDGIDGLCGSVTVITSLSFAMLSCSMSLWENSIFAIALAGACLGFLVWNLHPAKVFMGDTGSMFLGGAIVSIGLATGEHIIIFIMAFVYIAEALSVVIQRINFKATKGKRLFKMSPIHHHFELVGFSEYKIVVTFSITALILGVVGNLIYNL